MSVLPLSLSQHIVRAKAAPTSSYVAGTIVSMEDQNYVGFEIDYTKGDESNIKVKVEISVDGTNYYQEITEGASGGTITATAAERVFAATGKYSFSISPTRGRLVKVSVVATSGTPTGTVGINAHTAWV